MPSPSTVTHWSCNPSAKCYVGRWTWTWHTYLLTEPTKNATTSPAKAWYRKLLAEKILNHLPGILSFCNKLPEPESSILKELCVDAASIQAKLAKQHQYIPQLARLGGDGEVAGHGTAAATASQSVSSTAACNHHTAGCRISSTCRSLRRRSGHEFANVWKNGKD
uniref:Uncharacterized protein n=1 Tax=Oryza meridionalis TaxID=40149 RepID=A0A0E0FAW9_9ORYZ